jgi:GxxExxY protein
MKVHRHMRNGYPELIYHKCLMIEFKKNILSFRSEIKLPIFYEDIKIGKRTADCSD